MKKLRYRNKKNSHPSSHSSWLVTGSREIRFQVAWLQSTSIPHPLCLTVCLCTYMCVPFQFINKCGLSKCIRNISLLYGISSYLNLFTKLWNVCHHRFTLHCQLWFLLCRLLRKYTPATFGSSLNRRANSSLKN